MKALQSPPPFVRGDRTSGLRALALLARGRRYPIGDHVEGDHPWGMGMDQTGQLQLSVRDPDHKLVSILDDEAYLLQDGVRLVLNGVTYCVSGVEHDGDGLFQLSFEDEVSWRLKQFSSFKAAPRSRVTRFGFIHSFVREASRPPLAVLRSFIPEVDDKQPIRKAARR